jgi:DNA-directed RNA polymerase subunit E'/Rpb7
MPFRLVEFEEDVRLAPDQLGRPPAEALASAVEAAFVDRVVPGAGLVVSVVAPLAARGGDIHPAGGGAARWTVRFSAAVFRPEPRDIMVGTICAADR